MTFLTKSDKMGTCPFGVENVALASSAPALASALASSASVGPEVVQVVQRMWSISLRFPLQTDMCPKSHFWSKKWCENSYVSHYFSTWSNLVTFGPKNHQIQQSFPVSNRHVQKWKFHLPEMLKFPRDFAHFWEVKFPFLHMLIWDRNYKLKSMVFWTKTDKVAPSPKVV